MPILSRLHNCRAPPGVSLFPFLASLLLEPFCCNRYCLALPSFLLPTLHKRLLGHPCQEPLRPLLSVASGGEVARVMLAIKAAMAISEGATNTIPPVLILDEIDSGVGARLGAEVGSLLARMSCRGAALSQVYPSHPGHEYGCWG